MRKTILTLLVIALLATFATAESIDNKKGVDLRFASTYQSSKIEDKTVVSFDVTDEGEILYTYAYSKEEGEGKAENGSLMSFLHGKQTKIYCRETYVSTKKIDGKSLVSIEIQDDGNLLYEYTRSE